MIKYKNKINNIINTDAIYTKNHYFFATHSPFKNLEYIPSVRNSLNSVKISEEEFLHEYIVKNIHQHTLCVIQGNNGTGKSHLIKWLNKKLIEYKDENNDEIVFIKREDATLKSALKQLVSIDFFEDHVEARKKFDILLDSDNIEDENKIINQVILQLTIAMLDEEYEQNIELRESTRIGLRNFFVDINVQNEVLKKENGFFDRLSKRLVEKSESRTDDVEARMREQDIELDFKLVTLLKKEGADKKALRFAEKLLQNKDDFSKKIVKYINSLMEVAIQKTVKLNTSDFMEVFKNIRIYLNKHNKNLILLVEDITSLTGLDKALLEALKVDHSEDDSNLCRLFSIVGITNSYYEDLRSNYRDRITYRIQLGDDVVFATDKDIISFASRYISCLYVDQNEYLKWYESGALLSDKPEPKNDEFPDWAVYEGRLIYPFNSEAILRLFYSMDEGMRTPRYFLKDILSPTLDLYDVNSKEFPPTVDQFRKIGINLVEWSSLKTIEELKVVCSNVKEIDRFNSLMLLYSDLTTEYTDIDSSKKYGGLSLDVFDNFNIELNLNGQAVVKKDPIGISGNVERTPPTPPVVNPIKPEKSEFDKKLERFRNEVKKWNDDLDDSIQLRTVRVSLVNMIIDIFDYDAFFINKKDLQKNFSIGSIALETKFKNIHDKLIIPREESSKALLEAAFNFKEIGDNSWNYDKALYDFKQIVLFVNKNVTFFKKLEEGIIQESEEALTITFTKLYIMNYLENKLSDSSVISVLYQLIDRIRNEYTKSIRVETFDKLLGDRGIRHEIELSSEIAEAEVREAIEHYSGATGIATATEAKGVVIDIVSIKAVLEKTLINNQTFITNVNQVIENYNNRIESDLNQINEMTGGNDLSGEIIEFLKYIREKNQAFPADLSSNLTRYMNENIFSKVQQVAKDRSDSKTNIEKLENSIEVERNKVRSLVNLMTEFDRELNSLVSGTKITGANEDIISNHDVESSIDDMLSKR